VNGIVGIKPTVGLLSRSGIIPISKTQDTAGPMARTVKDAAILLGILAGADADDSFTKDSKPQADYTKFLDANGLQGKRLGLEKAALDGNPDMEALLQDAIAVLKSKGATIVEIELNKALKVIPPTSEFNVLLYEFKDGLAKYFSTYNTKVKSLADVIAFNKANAAKCMPFFKQEIMDQAQAKGDLNSKEYLDAVKSTTGARGIISKIMVDNKLDAIIGPTNGFACTIDLVNGDYDNGFGFSTAPAIAGFPHITVPMGFGHGLPMGLSFFSTAYKEADIIKLAYAYEQASKKRMKPEFKVDLLG